MLFRSCSRHRRKAFAAHRNGLYDSSQLAGERLRRAIAFQNAERLEVEDLRMIKDVESPSEPPTTPVRRKKKADKVDDKDNAADHNLAPGSIPRRVDSWYGLINHQLYDAFRHDRSVFVCPKYQLQYHIFNHYTRKDDVTVCTPDFCVLQSTGREPVIDLVTEPSRIMLLVLCNPSEKTVMDIVSKYREEGIRIRKQAGILFSIHEEQECVGAIITVGSFWTFAILSRDDATYPGRRDMLDTTHSCVDPVEKEFFPELFQFGTSKSDRKFLSIGKKLLKLFPRPRP